MSAEMIQPDGATVVRLADRRPVDPMADTVRLGREQAGAAVEKLPDAAPKKPGILRLTGLGLATLVRDGLGYILASDDYGQLIRDAKAAARQHPRGSDARKEALELLAVLREQRDAATRQRAKEPRTIAAEVGTVVGAATVAITVTVGGVALGAVLLAPAPIVGYLVGRREQKARDTALPEGSVELAVAGQAHAAVGGAAAAANVEQPPLDGGALAAAYRAAGFTGDIQVIDAEELGDGSSITRFKTPAHVTVTMLRKKDEVIAGALGRDLSMIDITKEGAANLGSLWMTDRDPFEDPRPSPLLTHRGAVDAWGDGVPVAWSKRGDYVRLPIKNSNFLIAGMTRSGKGVGAANLAAGAAKDVRVNLRFVAGKVNGEWDPYAKTGIASTYFKPDPERLLALLRAEIADGDRRNRLLGEFGKSKLTPETIERLGGLEVVVIDELATFTRSGKPLRDEILDALIYISSVLAGAGILLVLITQYPEADVVPQALAMNCGTRWAMRVDNATQSNAILGGGASSSGRDASKFDPPRPGLGWLVNPFLGVTDLARSFDLDEDERGEVTQICEQAAELREAAGRLTGQWDDPIERHLLNATGLSSAAGGPRRDGQPGRALATLTAEQKQQLAALKGALAAMDQLDRDTAQLTEMAGLIGGGMTAPRLGDLLRAAGAGGTVKVDIPGLPNRVNGYNRSDIQDALDLFEGH